MTATGCAWSATETVCGCFPGAAWTGPSGTPGSSRRHGRSLGLSWTAKAVVLGVDGISDFNALHSRQHDEEVQLYAFDIPAHIGDDLTRLPLHLRKTNLQQLLRGRSDGIFVAPFEQGEIGPDLFRAACNMHLEGLVSKHRERSYRAGRSDNGSRSRTGSIPPSPA
jgi:bifunctional non-homologous end joining protein LigD